MSMLPSLVKIANGIAVFYVWRLPLHYEIPTEIFKHDSTKLIVLCTAVASFWIGMNLALKTQAYFNGENAESRTKNLDKRNLISLLISLGIGATFLILNTSRANQLFQRVVSPLTSITMRGVAYGYMSMQVVTAYDAVFLEG